MTFCPRCLGLGIYSRNNRNYGTCFSCNGTGQAKERKGYFQVNYSPAPVGRVDFADDDDDDAPAKAATPSEEVIRCITEQRHLSRRITDEEDSRKRADEALLETILAELERRAPRRIELTRQGEVVAEVAAGDQHPNFATLLRLATSRDVGGYVPNIWLAGPSQSGKTTAAANLAKALSLPFFYNGALSTDFQVLGYRDAGGTYHSTPFIDAVAQPSVYLFDDIDSCDTNAPLLALNGALANGLVSCPAGQIERHRDCIVIATGNTWGLGATSDYCGRIKLDAAFLARFPAKLEWGYDENFEARICGNPSWARQVQRARRQAQEVGLKVVIGMSVSKAGAALIANGFTPDEAADLTYLASLSADQRRILQ